MTEDEKYLHNHFLISIKSGLQSLEDIIDESLEIVDEERLQSEVSEEWLRTSIEEKYEKNEEESKTWDHPTDTERLCKAFDILCSKNILALHNAGYDKHEAEYDGQTVWEEIEDEGGTPTGYCYYHGQDLERVIQTGILPIGFFGKKEKNDKEAIMVGNTVTEVLKQEGFEIKWDGTAATRIELINFEWQNVFISEEDTEEKWSYDRAIKLMTK